MRFFLHLSHGERSALRSSPGEGSSSIDRPKPLTRISRYARNSTSPYGRGVAASWRRTSIVGIALFVPRIATVVIAADFPVARCILVQEFDRLQPFRAFPEIEMRHHQPHRAAVFCLKRRAGPAMGEQGVNGGEIF